MSRRPKSSSSAKFDKELAEKIIHLHDSEGKGFRKIGKELGRSKSDVHRIYVEHATAFREETEKELDEDEEYKTLKETGLKLQKEVEAEEARERERENIRKLWLRKAETQEGIRDIFSSPAKMLEFAKVTVDYRSLIPNSPVVLKSFEDYCKSRKLPLAETLSEAVGSLKEYYTDGEEGGLVDLDNYVGVELEHYLIEQQEREMQRRFETMLPKLRCKCGESIQSGNILIDGDKDSQRYGQLKCKCGNVMQLLCLKCQHGLTFDSEKKEYHCRRCILTFKLPEKI